MTLFRSLDDTLSGPELLFDFSFFKLSRIISLVMFAKVNDSSVPAVRKSSKFLLLEGISLARVGPTEEKKSLNPFAISRLLESM